MDLPALRLFNFCTGMLIDTGTESSACTDTHRLSAQRVTRGVYRHPNQCIKDFHMYFDKLLSVLSLLKRRCIIAGDINIDFIKIIENKDTADYLNNLLINSFMPTILMPTRITANSATLIDHILIVRAEIIKA